MPLDRHARRFLEMLAAAGEARGRYDDVEQRRSALVNLANLVDPPGTVEIGGVRDHLMTVQGGEGGHITLRIYSPLGEPSRALPGILFFHGGGWVAGSLETHDGFCRRLCNETGCRVIAVDYRLAPQHPFPYGLKDAVAALYHVARNPKLFGIDPARLGVAGDSAGGTMAAVLCRIARDFAHEGKEAPAIAFQLLICPILDVHGDLLRAATWRKAISWTAKPCAGIWNCMFPRAWNCPTSACRRSAPRNSLICRRPSSIPGSSIPSAMKVRNMPSAWAVLAWACMAGPIPA